METEIKRNRGGRPAIPTELREEIRQRYAAGESKESLAVAFDCSYGTIRNIVEKEGKAA